MQHRPDIDDLAKRAFLPVILLFAGVGQIFGGLAGVDTCLFIVGLWIAGFVTLAPGAVSVPLIGSRVRQSNQQVPALCFAADFARDPSRVGPALSAGVVSPSRSEARR